MPLFDAYVMVDWSSRGKPTPTKPSKDAIWVGSLGPEKDPEATYHRTREEATTRVRDLLTTHLAIGRRVLVGFDFPYGYPRGFAAEARLTGADEPWLAVWRSLSARVSDSPGNVSNHFAVAAEINTVVGSGPGPFWGCHGAVAAPTLTRKRPYDYPYEAPGGALHKFRATEQALHAAKLRPQEAWKLAGNGCVGSQALVGIPRVHALRFDPDLRDVSRVWPFETGLTSAPTPTRGPSIVHAEIWPGIVDPGRLATEMAIPGTIKDQAQVRLMCRWARDHDAAGTLGAWFGPEAVGTADPDVVVREEGWILGGHALP